MQEVNASADMGDQAATPQQGLEGGDTGGEPTTITDVSPTDTTTTSGDSGGNSTPPDASQGVQGLDSNKPVTVVGETMSRVNAAAQQLRDAGFDVNTYNPESTVPSMEANRSWLRYWAKIRGSQIVDVGFDEGRGDPSKYYAMEDRSLTRWGINRLRLAWPPSQQP
jgi:rhodanese-related sulfurtransferase